MKIAYILFRYT